MHRSAAVLRFARLQTFYLSCCMMAPITQLLHTLPDFSSVKCRGMQLGRWNHGNAAALPGAGEIINTDLSLLCLCLSHLQGPLHLQMRQLCRPQANRRGRQTCCAVINHHHQLLQCPKGSCHTHQAKCAT